jgi:hypothetical protein
MKSLLPLHLLRFRYSHRLSSFIRLFGRPMPHSQPPSCRTFCEQSELSTEIRPFCTEGFGGTPPMSRPKAESCPLQEANEFCGGVHPQRRLLAALPRRPVPVPARLQTAADRIEVRILNDQRAIRQSLRRRCAPRKEGSD